MLQRSHQSAEVVRGQDHGSGAAGAYPGGAEGNGAVENCQQRLAKLARDDRGLIGFFCTDSNW